ncbi:hypothetical protein LINPERHAP2_LOCUS34933 [Linum perenne]
MDKSWIYKPRLSPEYMAGLESFLDFAFSNNNGGEQILCPCPKCGFKKWLCRDDVYEHLLRKPFPQGYSIWDRHGEHNFASSSGINPPTRVHNYDPTGSLRAMINDAFGVVTEEVPETTDAFGVVTEAINEEDQMNDDNGPMLEYSNMNIPNDMEEPVDEPVEENINLRDLLKDGETALYEGCTKFSKLSFILRLYHIKGMHNISDKAMSMIIELLHEAFGFANIPPTGYSAKKMIKNLGLGYTKIDACANDCMLYWGNSLKDTVCRICKQSRYKDDGGDGGDEVVAGSKKTRKAMKIYRYFPLIPRLKRLFMCPTTAESMVWHSTERSTDGMSRHPRDGQAWIDFDTRYPEFASDPRNIRFGLATDGFNPFGNMSLSHSTWPIILMPYNTPPWECMKSTGMMLSSIIPGKKAPGNDIDVYLQPLIDELRMLWEGVEAYDAVKKEPFLLRAALMWTISDFPGLSLLSGWNTYTGQACPTCNFDQEPLRLAESGKNCFIGSRRFLPAEHPFRLQKTKFNGEIDLRQPTKLLSGTEILSQVENINVTFGKTNESDKGGPVKKKSKIDGGNKKKAEQWKKKSCFFQLPYWEFNKLRHNFDVMHIEKNVCDNLLYTLINEKDRRDHLKARMDLKIMKIRRDLWPRQDGKSCPAAIYTMGKREIQTMLETLKDLTVPDGYSSNISRCVDVENRKILGLKTHDCHILMHELLPLSILNVLPLQVSSVIVEFSSCLKQVCSKVVHIDGLDALEKRIVVALCRLEMLFPPILFHSNGPSSGSFG